MNNTPDTPADKGHHPVIIIGAGMAGLSAALHLAERGIPPLLLEADPDFLGGRVSGGEFVTVDGWQFRDEHGVHGIWSPYRNLQAMLTRNHIRPMMIPSQEETWIYKRGDRIKKADAGSAIRRSWLPAPLHYLALFLRPRFLGMLGLRDWLSLPLVWYGLMLAVAIDPLKERQPLEGLWLSDLVKRWSPALRAFFVGLVRNGMPARPEDVPLSGFIAFLRFYTLMRRDAWAFSYLPRDGGSSLVDPMVEKIRSLGGVIQQGVRVEQLSQFEDGWQLSAESSMDGQHMRFTADQLIMAVDSPASQKILHANPALAADVAGYYWPQGMATAVIRLWFDLAVDKSADSGSISGDAIVNNFFWLHRIQDEYRKWHKSTGGSAIELHIYGPPELLEEPDTALLSRAIADVRAIFPSLRGHRIHQTLRRNSASHTLFGVGPAGRHMGIHSPWPNLYCCGDWVYHPSPAFFLERACITGIEAANAVLDKQGSPTWPLVSYLPPEPTARFIERLMLGGRRSLLKHKRRKRD